MNWSYVVIPVLVCMVAAMGSVYTSGGMMWYRKIKLPSWTPPGGAIGFVWTVIFVLTAVSAISFWNAPVWVESGRLILARLCLVYAFLLNAFLNVFWSWLFFHKHRLRAAVTDAVGLAASVYFLIFILYPVTPFAALLLIPYAAWVTFAAFLSWRISVLNRSKR